MGLANIGNAQGAILLDASGVRAAINEARGALGRLGEAGGQITALGGALTALTAPLLIFGKTGIDAAGDFDAAMRELSARTGIVGDDLDTMKQAAIDAGAATIFSATDAANSLLQLTSSGLSAKEALEVLPVVMDGAAASGMNLGTTADMVTDIMAQFGLEAGDARDVLNALVKASGSGSATVSELSQGFQNAGGIAAMFGMSVDETAAALQVFSENGIKGAEAGTQLKSMLTNMTRQTSDVQSAWKELGVSMYDTQGNVRDLDDVIDDLNASMADMSQEDRISYIQRLAGSYGQAGLTALLSSGGINSMLTSMDNAADAATVADQKMEGWGGATENLSGSIETLQIQVLTPFINNTLVPLLNDLSEIINKVTEWAKANPELANKIVMLLAALSVLGPTLVVIGTVISSVATILGVLAGALLSPIGLVVLLGTAWATNFGGMRDAVDDVRQALDEGDIGGVLWGIARALFAIPLGIATWIGEMGGISVPDGLAAWDGIISNLGTIINALPGYITSWLERATGISVPEGLTSWSSVTEAIQTAITWISDNAGKLLSGINISIPDPLQSFADLVEDIVGWLGDITSFEMPDIDMPDIKTPSTGTFIDDINPFNASGGAVGANEPIYVGERGPEWFVPHNAGHIIPNDRLDSVGGGDTYHINVQVPADMLRDDARIYDNAQMFGEQLAAALAARGG